MKPRAWKTPFELNLSTFGLSVLFAALVISGCSRTNNSENKASDKVKPHNTHLVNLDTLWKIYFSEPLFIQVSERPTVIMWQLLGNMGLPPEFPPQDNTDSTNVTSSTLDDIQTRAANYSQAQDRKTRPAPIVITGDNKAKCGSVFEAIAKAKRAGISELYFETYDRKTGETGPASWQSRTGEKSRRVSNSSDPIIITITQNITKDTTLLWNNGTITLYEYCQRLNNIPDDSEPNIPLFIVRVHPDISFGSLRYVLDQLHRTYIEYAAIELCEGH